MLKNNNRKLTLPLAENGLYKASDILQIDGFPFKKTKFYKMVKDGVFLRHKGSSYPLYSGKCINEWFNEILTNQQPAA